MRNSGRTQEWYLNLPSPEWRSLARKDFCSSLLVLNLAPVSRAFSGFLLRFLTPTLYIVRSDFSGGTTLLILAGKLDSDSVARLPCAFRNSRTDLLVPSMCLALRALSRQVRSLCWIALPYFLVNLREPGAAVVKKIELVSRFFLVWH